MVISRIYKFILYFIGIIIKLCIFEKPEYINLNQMKTILEEKMNFFFLINANKAQYYLSKTKNSMNRKELICRYEIFILSDW